LNYITNHCAKNKNNITRKEEELKKIPTKIYRKIGS
jgi:hypothetical protein